MISIFLKTTKIIFVLLVFSMLFSCTPRKELIYFSTNTKTNEVSTNSVLGNYKLNAGDMLYIKVLTLDDNTYKLFNSDWKNAQLQSEIGLFIDSYTISDSGFVRLPIVGNISIIGLSLQDAQKEIQEKLSSYLLDATVSIKFINYKITVLGEVNKPGTFKIYNNNIDVLEAISLAGDLTVFGNRKNIMVLRKSENNKTAYIDITDVNVVNSEFFQLKPNDIIYIQPTVAKSLGFKEFPFSILFSSITTVIVLINFFNK